MVLVMFVIYWDLYHHSLTSAFHSAVTTRWRYLVAVLWINLTLHLFNLIPYEWDLVWRIGNILHKVMHFSWK